VVRVAAAGPPDVRKARGLPSSASFLLGYAPKSGRSPYLNQPTIRKVGDLPHTRWLSHCNSLFLHNPI
jgi:hypothetical protein